MKKRFGRSPHLLKTAGNLHAARLAAAARVNLRLDAPNRAAQPLGGCDGVLDAFNGLAAGHRNAGLLQKRLGLIFMDLHLVNPVRTPTSLCVLIEWRLPGNFPAVLF